MGKGKDMLSISQAAEFLGVSIQTLRRWDASGRLLAIKTEGGHRYYRQSDLVLFGSNIRDIAYAWAIAHDDIPREYYCADSATFQSRLVKMQDALLQNPKTGKNFSLITAMAGEVGNNSFDHNLGNWPDTPGIFFGYDMHRGIVILADRGCGILATLRRVRPSLENHQEALRVAFTEVVSGRAPEQRGNGLKFVAGVVSENNFHLTFQTGDALLEMQPQQKALSIRQAKEWMSGCYMVLQY